MSYRIVAALALSLGLSTAALAQTDTTTGGAAGAGGEVMLPAEWQGDIASALFSDPQAGTLKSEEEIRSGWGSLSADQQAQVRSECETHMAAAGTGTDTMTGGASTDTTAGAATSTDDTTAGASTDTTAGASTDTTAGASTDTTAGASTDTTAGASTDTTAGASTDTAASTDTDTDDQMQTGATTGTDTTAGASGTATTGAADEPITIAEADMTQLCTTIQGMLSSRLPSRHEKAPPDLAGGAFLRLVGAETSPGRNGLRRSRPPAAFPGCRA
jgi:hypothetical protein